MGEQPPREQTRDESNGKGAMPLETELTRALGIRVPVVQGGMMFVGEPNLVAAVSNAGGLGILTGLTPGSPAKLREAIRRVRELTSKPFAVNLTFLPSIAPPPYEEYAQVIIDEGVKIAETAGGPAAIPVIKMYKKAGIYVIHKCTSIGHAKSAEKLGVDMLSIDGFECAGHPGEDDIGGLVLLCLAARKLKIPYIASGGFADGRGLAAALALGAAGINCGTLFMATKESYIHENVKQAIVKASEEVVRMERRPGGVEFKEIAPLVSGARGRVVYEQGDVDHGIWSASPVVGLIDDIPSCETLLRRLEGDAEHVIGDMHKMVKLPSKL